MGVVTLTPEQVPGELREVLRRQRHAIRVAIKRTLEIDAPRWIDWSIRGGDANKLQLQPTFPVPSGPQKSSRAGRTPKARVAGVKRGKAPKGPSKVASKKSSASGCGAKPPAGGYRAPIDTGNYRQAWASSVDGDRGYFYSTASPIAKAVAIEVGRAPGPIPIEPLADWVRRKFGCSDPVRARAIAFLISRKASRQRRPALKVLERAHPKIAEAFQRNLVEALRAAQQGR